MELMRIFPNHLDNGLVTMVIENSTRPGDPTMNSADFVALLRQNRGVPASLVNQRQKPSGSEHAGISTAIFYGQAKFGR